MPFCTLDQIKNWIGIELSNTTHDDVLTIIRDAMETSVVNYTETSFELVVKVNEVLDANESDVVVPPYSPIVSVQALYFYTLPDGSDGQLIDPNDYQVRQEAIYLQNIHTPFKRSRVRVDYTYGYDGLPDDIKLMLLQAIEAEFRRKGSKTLGRSSRSKKDESEGLSGSSPSYWDTKTGLPKELVYKLNYYKRMEWPVQPMATRNI